MSMPTEVTHATSPEERRALLARMLREQGGRPVADGAGAPRSDERPLSPGQERLWLVSRLEPGEPLYHIAVAYRLLGPLDRGALGRGLGRIAARHEVLRSAFPTDRPVQVVGDAVPVPLSTTDLRGVPEAAREAEVEARALASARRPFDMARGPLWRVELIRWGDEGHDLVVVMHHLVSDAWSFAVLARELSACYDAERSGTDSSLPGLPIAYSGFGERQRRWLSSPMAGQASAYWRGQLDGVGSGPRLPADRPAASAIDRRGASVPLSITPTTAGALAELSRREGATLFMTLLAGFAALLHRYGGQEDIVIATPASGRHRSGARDLIGYFNNLLPLRLDLRGDPGFLDLLRGARRASLDAFKHQDLPFQIIADAPHLKAVALSRVLFSLDIAWPPPLELSGLASEARAVRIGTSDVDLFVSIWEEGGGLRGVFEYKSGLFDEATIAAMIADYTAVLAAVAEAPERPLSTLPAPPRPVSAEGPAPAEGRGASAYRAPGLPSELRIVRACEEILGVDPIGMDDNLFELGATSLALARLSERLRGEFRVDLPLSAIVRARTVAGITPLVAGGSAVPSSPLAPIRTTGSLPPLFLCEGIGVYYPLIRHLDPERPVYALYTETAGNFPTVEELAAAYLVEVRAVQAEGPYFLGGLSFGGVVAFEMAQQLVDDGQEVGALALFDTPTPWAAARKPLLRLIAGHLANLRRFGLVYARRKAARLLQRFRRGLGRANGPDGTAAPGPIPPREQLRMLFKQTADAYSSRPYPGRIDLFMLAKRDAMSDGLFDPALHDIDPQLGWGRLAPGRVAVHPVPGGHISMFGEPHVQALAQELTACLEAARRDASTAAGPRATPTA